MENNEEQVAQEVAPKIEKVSLSEISQEIEGQKKEKDDALVKRIMDKILSIK